MRLLLDSHSLIWAVDSTFDLGSNAFAALQDPNNVLLLSAGSIWEISIKTGLKKLTLSQPFRPWMEIRRWRISACSLLPISRLRQPTCRLVSRSTTETRSTAFSSQSLAFKPFRWSPPDTILDQYGVTRVW